MDPTVSTRTGVTINIYLYQDGSNSSNPTGNPQAIPEYYDIWIGVSAAGGWSSGDDVVSPNYNTKEGEMSIETDANGYYYVSYTFDIALTIGVEYDYYLVFESKNTEADDDGLSWSHEVTDLSFTLDKYQTTIEQDVVTWHDFESWVPEYVESGIEFYIVVFDDLGNASSSSFGNITTMTATTNCFSGSYTSGVTCAQNSNAYNQYYVYNTTAGTGSSGDAINITVSGSGVQFYVYSESLPSPEAGCVAIFYCVMQSANIGDSWNAWSSGWDTTHESVSSYISSVSSWMS